MQDHGFRHGNAGVAESREDDSLSIENYSYVW